VKSVVFLILSLVVGGSLCRSAYGQSTTLGLPNATASSVGTRDSDDSVRVIGNLPYSNQWVFERASNYLYFNFDSSTLASQNIKVSHFQTQFTSTRFNLLSLDFHSRLFTLADPLGSSFFRRFSFWGRYKVGFGMIDGTLVDTTEGTPLPAEKNSLLVLQGGVALDFAYDWSDWVQPYVGFNFKPYYFRNTSSMSSAESEGNNSVYGPSVGVHLPVLFSHKGSLFAEVHEDLVTSGSSQIFTNEIAGDFGVGLTF
jgi:hypothetical protein